MANRFTAPEKWYDPWFCELNEKDKLFWIYICDNCNHAGIWQVNWPLVKFHIKDYEFNKEVFKGRIEILSEETWFLKKFILFQQKINSLEELNPLNKCHLSIINILTTKGLISPKKAPKKGLGRGQGNSNSNSNKGVVKGGNSLSDEEFIKTLKNNPAYSHINIDNELDKMDGWLLVHKGRQKTPRFIVNWLNKIDKPVSYKKPNELPQPQKKEEVRFNPKVADLIHKTAEKLKAK